VTINVLANDFDPDGDPLVVSSVTPPQFGSVVLNPNNTITYTLGTGSPNPESFTYTISDGRGGSAGAIVTVSTVIP